MSNGLITAAYIIAAIMFILSLAGLSKQETARNGNKFGIIGMVDCIDCHDSNCRCSKY